MTSDPQGNIWFAFSDLVDEWDGAAYHTAIRKGKGVSESTMFVRGDRIWLGGAGGVQLFSKGEFHTVKWRDGDLPGGVSGLLETASGDLWINGFSGIVHVSSGELNKWLRDPA